MGLDWLLPWRRRPALLLITDPGPDPDDIKAILVVAALHRRRQIAVKGVIANGGCQALARAKLARCVLDKVGARDIPVGIGSAGKPYEPVAHEYALPGYESVDAARLEPGHALLMRALRHARDKSLTIVCISSLRDLADAIAEARPLVVRKTLRVAIQGGLEWSDEKTAWEPDTSVNNEFDRDAASAVYAFCFAEGVPLTVVSRHAVPLLPMQLARSFAERTESDVLRYLANAQFLGLAGLWRKLCEGRLPARCTKQWYFETFCGVPAAKFGAHGYDALDGTADITQHLNGYVKPYDVVALMAALPHTQRAFGPGAPPRDALAPAPSVRTSPPRTPSVRAPSMVSLRSANANASRSSSLSSFSRAGGGHCLYLSPEHAIDVAHVVKLLRNVYHEAALTDEAAGAERGPRSAAASSAASGAQGEEAAGAARGSKRSGSGHSSRRSSKLRVHPRLARAQRADADELRASAWTVGSGRTRTAFSDTTEGDGSHGGRGSEAGGGGGGGGGGGRWAREPGALLEEAEIVALLEAAVRRARERARLATLLAALLAFSLFVAAAAMRGLDAAAWVQSSAGRRREVLDGGRGDAAALDSAVAEDALWMRWRAAGLTLHVAFALCALALQPIPSHSRITRASALVFCLVVGVDGYNAMRTGVRGLSALEEQAGLLPCEAGLGAALRAAMHGVIATGGAAYLAIVAALAAVWLGTAHQPPVSRTRARVRAVWLANACAAALLALLLLGASVLCGPVTGWLASRPTAGIREYIHAHTGATCAVAIALLWPGSRERTRWALLRAAAHCASTLRPVRAGTGGAPLLAALAPLVQFGEGESADSLGQLTREALRVLRGVALDAAFFARAEAGSHRGRAAAGRSSLSRAGGGARALRAARLYSRADEGRNTGASDLSLLDTPASSLSGLGRRLSAAARSSGARLSGAGAPAPPRSGVLGSCCFGGGARLVGRRKLSLQQLGEVAQHAMHNLLDARADVRAVSTLEQLRHAQAPEVDRVVVHSAFDDPRLRMRALAEWGARFEAANGRPARVWLWAACADASLTHAEQLAHVVVYLCRARGLLVLAGPTVPDSLECVVQLLAFRACGGAASAVDVAVVGESEAARRAAVAAFDAFHVVYARARSRSAAERHALVAAVEQVGAPRVNEAVRALLPAVQRAAAAAAAADAKQSDRAGGSVGEAEGPAGAAADGEDATADGADEEAAAAREAGEASDETATAVEGMVEGVEAAE